MSTAAEAILKQALGLDPIERAELIEKLFHSFDKTPDQEIDKLWADEAESRIDAYDAGQICADSAKAAFERINKR
jgi:putative addiction module component (TIGR02574 family)